MQYCPFCGSEQPDTAHFCSTCGRTIVSGDVVTLRHETKENPYNPQTDVPGTNNTPYPYTTENYQTSLSGSPWPQSLQQPLTQSPTIAQVTEGDKRPFGIPIALPTKPFTPDSVLMPQGGATLSNAAHGGATLSNAVHGGEALSNAVHAGEPLSNAIHGGIDHPLSAAQHGAGQATPIHTGSSPGNLHIDPRQPAPQSGNPPAYQSPSRPPTHPITDQPTQPLKHPSQPLKHPSQPLKHPSEPLTHHTTQPLKHHSKPLKHTAKHHHAHSPLVIAAIVIVCLIIIGGGAGAFYIFSLTPAITLSSTPNVSQGGTLHIHGDHFIPGSNVVFLLDNNIPVSPSAFTSTPVTQSGIANSAGIAVISSAISYLTQSSLKVDSSGTFNVALPVSSGWLVGKHTLHAIEATGIGTRRADLQFTIMSNAAQLSVDTTKLNFGAQQQGQQTSQAFTIGNTGGSTLNWTADTGTTSWLKLPTKTGTVQINAPDQHITVTSDTSTLAVGNYSATIQISSNGGSAAIIVTVQVVKAGQKPQAKLAVTPLSLSFAPMSRGQKQTATITISNIGTAQLTWQTAIDNSTWATLDNTGGSITSGGTPQTSDVSIDTTTLTPGNYATTLVVSSNGGTAQIAITLTVTVTATPSPTPSPTLHSPTPAPSPTPSPTVPPLTPTPSPTPVPPILRVSPTSFANGNGCSYSANHGWYCFATLTNTSNQSNLAWSATSNGSPSVSFSLANGVLAPNASSHVMVIVDATTICPARAILAFHGPANTVSIPWSCGTPTLSASPTTLTLSNCTFTPTGSGEQCVITLSDDVGGANWTASGNANVSFSSTSGTVYPSGSAPITVTILGCAQETFSFNGPGNSVTVTWIGDCIT